jgi:RNA polymerase sigma-70 factor, ECF subfamily
MKTTEDIWLEYHNRLHAFIKGRVTDHQAEDILQDVFLKIHTRIDTLRDGAKLESWLYQITRNAVIDHYRSKKETVGLPDWIEQVPSDTDGTIRRELSLCLAPMIEQLPDKYRVAIQLSEIEGKTQKEVAELEEISLSGAKSRVQRGRAQLKSMLLDCCQIEVNHNNQLVLWEEKEQECKTCDCR